MALTKAINWRDVGNDLLYTTNLSNAIRIYGNEILKQRSILNSFYC